MVNTRVGQRFIDSDSEQKKPKKKYGGKCKQVQ